MEVSRPFSPGEYYFSAPTSPSHLSQFYSHEGFDDLLDCCGGDGLSSAVPFDWEEKPGTPKSPLRTNNCDDFAFDLSRNSDTASLSAEELFDGGVIKPLKPPPRLQFPPAAARNGESTPERSSPRTSVSHTRNIIRGALFSPRHNKDAPAAAAAAAHRGPSTRRVARSLSPVRDRRFSWKQAEEEKRGSSPAAAGKGHKKWKLKNFFLFRSASEGRADGKDSLKKYTAAMRFGSVEDSGSDHELHYKVNRAVSKKKKKKTLVPYKQGIVGRFSYNPAISSLANAFGFSRK